MLRTSKHSSPSAAAPCTGECRHRCDTSLFIYKRGRIAALRRAIAFINTEDNTERQR